MANNGRPPSIYNYYSSTEVPMKQQEQLRLERLLNEGLVDAGQVGLDAFVSDLREGRSRPVSWNQIAFNIQTITDIQVSGEWLRTKYG